VEKVLSHKKDRTSSEYIYVVKWKGWDSKDITEEPEAHLPGHVHRAARILERQEEVKDATTTSGTCDQAAG